MAAPLPHSKEIRSEVEIYVEEVAGLATAAAGRLKSDGSFINLYKSVWASSAVFAGLSRSETPSMSMAQDVAPRIPVHIMLGQLSSVDVELRRLIEVVCLIVYFTDHPVEWRRFKVNPSSGISRTWETPITYCAHREPAFYGNYLIELMGEEPSGLAAKAATQLRALYGTLSSTVHAAAAAAAAAPRPIHEPVDPSSLSKIASQVRSCLSDCVLVLGAHATDAFDSLEPMYRAWFDWLVGSAQAKLIRSGPFGLGR